MDSEYVPIKQIKFSKKGKDKIEIFLDDKSLTWVLADFDKTSDTIKYYMFELNRKGKTKRDFFCCTCGIPECTDIKIFSELKGDTLYLDFHNILKEPIKKQFYSIDFKNFVSEVERFLKTGI